MDTRKLKKRKGAQVFGNAKGMDRNGFPVTHRKRLRQSRMDDHLSSAPPTASETDHREPSADAGANGSTTSGRSCVPSGEHALRAPSVVPASGDGAIVGTPRSFLPSTADPSFAKTLEALALGRLREELLIRFHGVTDAETLAELTEKEVRKELRWPVGARVRFLRWKRNRQASQRGLASMYA